MSRILMAALMMTASPALAQHQGHGAASQTPAVPNETHEAGRIPPRGEGPTDKTDPVSGTAAAPQVAEEEAPPANPPVAGPSAAARGGAAHAADAIFGPADMMRARADLRREHGALSSTMLMIDRLEVVAGKRGMTYAWDAQAWTGGDVDRLWLKSEGEGKGARRPDDVEIQALYSHSLDPWFSLQGGIRQDLGSGPRRTYLAAGIQGLARYWFEVDGTVFVSNKGEITARFEGEYDLRLTQRVILQPNVEFDLSAQDMPDLGITAGLSRAEGGVRLRYEITREIAPYVGIRYDRAFGSRDIIGDRSRGGPGIAVGLRAWF